MTWTAYLHPVLMLLIVFPVGFAAAAFGIELQQVRAERARRKVSPKLARDRHIANGIAFLISLVLVATVGGFASEGLPAAIDTDWHGLGALVVVLLLVVSTALVTVRSFKRRKWARLAHSILNGTVMALLVIQFLSGGWMLRQLLRG
ncbi:MAG: DUF4079 domain-containing protein [Aphanocapsa lilacina HA4352-LM1]|nr:DUF4079 domain-containing protein [Aphanocapsa lilacina HA4352-LM1]